MQRYDITVLKKDETVTATKSIALPDLKAAWADVAAAKALTSLERAFALPTRPARSRYSPGSRSRAIFISARRRLDPRTRCSGAFAGGPAAPTYGGPTLRCPRGTVTD